MDKPIPLPKQYGKYIRKDYIVDLFSAMEFLLKILGIFLQTYDF